jgi:hypothetical protein
MKYNHFESKNIVLITDEMNLLHHQFLRALFTQKVEVIVYSIQTVEVTVYSIQTVEVIVSWRVTHSWAVTSGTCHLGGSSCDRDGQLSQTGFLLVLD